MVGRAGFTLVETIIALLLSSIVLVLVSTTFLVQNQYYASQTLHVGAHDNVRAATERIAGEIRLAMDDGFVIAGERTLTIRSPMVLALACARTGNDVSVHFEGGAALLDADEVAGIAIRDTLTGDWDYRAATTAMLDGGSAASATRCEANGADTTGAYDEFHDVQNLQVLYGSAPDPGTVMMLYRETTYQILPSVLEPGSLGLFRQIFGETAVEFATGMDTTAQFQYRTGGTTYADTILSAAIADIDAVRIVADARKPASTGGGEDVTFGWSVNVALRHVD